MKKRSDAAKISRHISEFLYDYAPNFLTSSEHTIKSYKDALTLYVMFLESMGVTPGSFGREHFEKNFVEKWIKWMVSTRGCCADTCNVRLGSLRTFLEYLGTKEVGFLYLYHEAKTVKRQKCVKKKVNGFTRAAVTAILNESNLDTKTGRRDLTLLMMLYGTAARIGEILSVKVEHLHLDAPKPYVNLYGKGGKMRTAYLLPRTVSNLLGYLREFHGANPFPNDYLFYSREGGVKGKLTEPAIDKRIKKYAASAHKQCKDVPVNAHAHQFRHAKASHWLEDGMNIVQVSFLLGHENLETTMKYLDVTLEEKINALATLESEKGRSTAKKWKSHDGTLSDYLWMRR
jgi:site-specific recombinase XerD